MSSEVGHPFYGNQWTEQEGHAVVLLSKRATIDSEVMWKSDKGEVSYGQLGFHDTDSHGRKTGMTNVREVTVHEYPHPTKPGVTVRELKPTGRNLKVPTERLAQMKGGGFRSRDFANASEVAKDNTVKAGDVPGHEFHGNQWTAGAEQASAEAEKSGDPSAHMAAYEAHHDAARKYLDAAPAAPATDRERMWAKNEEHTDKAAHHYAEWAEKGDRGKDANKGPILKPSDKEVESDVLYQHAFHGDKGVSYRGDKDVGKALLGDAVETHKGELFRAGAYGSYAGRGGEGTKIATPRQSVAVQQSMISRGLLKHNGDSISLTAAGRREALRLHGGKDAPLGAAMAKESTMSKNVVKAKSIKPGFKISATGKELTQRQANLGAEAAKEKREQGKNPASWVADEGLWEKAKEAAGKSYDEGDEAYWPVVTHIYENMGGAVKSTDAKDKQVVKAGDMEGHAFHGNQWTSGESRFNETGDAKTEGTRGHVTEEENENLNKAELRQKAASLREEHDEQGAKEVEAYMTNKAAHIASRNAFEVGHTAHVSGNSEEHNKALKAFQETKQAHLEAAKASTTAQGAAYHRHAAGAAEMMADSHYKAGFAGEKRAKEASGLLNAVYTPHIKSSTSYEDVFNRAVKAADVQTGGANAGVEEECPNCHEDVVDEACPGCGKPEMCPECGYCEECESVVTEAKGNEKTGAVKAAGSSEGAGKGHAARKSARADNATQSAHEASAKAHDTDEDGDHDAAADAHDAAHEAHESAYKAHAKAGGSKDAMAHHMAAMKMHKAAADFHRDDEDEDAKASAPEGMVYCRDAGVALRSDAKWTLDKPAEFQWMPGGVTTIQAHYADKAVLLTVECDADTARTVQASLDAWREKYPKQRPFGCIEHREEEAALYPDKFEWRDDPEPGVFCSAVPSALGARNVNGRIHRSWSPAFTTDAEYHKASAKGGVLRFPDHARGSQSNPARITGVAFSVGSLTNKPAFKNILPVRAKDAQQANQAPQPVKQNAVTQPKGRRMRIKFVKARGDNAAGTVMEIDEAGDEWKAIKASGDALEYDHAVQLEAKDAENKALRESVKANQKQMVKDKIAAAKARKAIALKDEAVQAKAFERIDKGRDDIDLICEVIDSMPPKREFGATAGELGGLGDRTIKAHQDDTIVPVGQVRFGKTTLREAGDEYIRLREPMKNLIQAGNVKEALALSLKASGVLRTNFMPVYAKGEDFMLEDVVTAADTTDPNSQVGTLSTGLLLMRNLGYLKNKLGFMPYISTDLRNEPAKYGQPILTRYITPPNVLTYVPGVGYTSDATTITNASISATTGEATTQTSGTKTPSAPSTTDVTIIINKHKAVEITFPTSTLGSTIRNLFAEQQGAQFYSLAEQVNKDFLTTAFSATWSGVIGNSFALGSSFGLPGLVAIKLRFSINKMPDIGRFILLHSTYHDQILVDSNLVTAKAIMALVDKNMSALESGELPVLYGLHVLESQLASANAGVLTSITDPTSLGATNQIGFAGDSAAMLFAARVPQDYTTIFKDIPATASIEILTEPDSGLSIMFTKYVDHGLAQVSARCALMYGFKQGDPRQGFILTP